AARSRGLSYLEPSAALAVGGQLVEDAVGFLRVELAQQQDRVEHELIVPVAMAVQQDEVAALVYEPLAERRIVQADQTFERVVLHRDRLVFQVADEDRAQVWVCGEARRERIERAGADRLLAVVFGRLDE